MVNLMDLLGLLVVVVHGTRWVLRAGMVLGAGRRRRRSRSSSRTMVGMVADRVMARMARADGATNARVGVVRMGMVRVPGARSRRRLAVAGMVEAGRDRNEAGTNANTHFALGHLGGSLADGVGEHKAVTLRVEEPHGQAGGSVGRRGKVPGTALVGKGERGTLNVVVTAMENRRPGPEVDMDPEREGLGDDGVDAVAGGPVGAVAAHHDEGVHELGGGDAGGGRLLGGLVSNGAGKLADGVHDGAVSGELAAA